MPQNGQTKSVFYSGFRKKLLFSISFMNMVDGDQGLIKLILILFLLGW